MTFREPTATVAIGTSSSAVIDPVKGGMPAGKTGADGTAGRDQVVGEGVEGSEDSFSSAVSDDAKSPCINASLARQSLQQIIDAPDAAAAEELLLSPNPPAEVPKGTWSFIPRSCAANVLPRARPAMPTLDEMRASRHWPVVVTPDPAVEAAGAPRFNGSADPRQQLEINGPAFEIESDLFKGKVIIHMCGLGTTDRAVFAGKKRLVHVIAQGKFKRRVRAASVCTGQEFNIPIAKGTGGEWILEQLLRACAKVFSKTTIVDAHGARPFFLNPLIAACQLINVSRDGQQPAPWDATEDCRLLSPKLVDDKGRPMAAEKRRKWCDDPANVEGLEFGTEHVYTMHVWQHMMDFGAYKAHVGFISVDLCAMISSQPLQLFIKDVDSGLYAYSALVWHEKLLYPDEHADKRRDDKRAKSVTEGGIAGRIGSGLRGLRMWSS